MDPHTKTMYENRNLPNHLPRLGKRPRVKRNEDLPRMSRQLKECKRYPKYCSIRLNGVATYAFIDSGNCLPNIISLDYAMHLGIKENSLKPAGIRQIGTAGKGKPLQVVGTTSKPLQLRFAGTGRVFPFRPLIVKQLVMNINIGGPFLRRIGAKQDYGKGTLEVETKKGHYMSVPLFSAAQLRRLKSGHEICSIQENEVVMYSTEKVTIPPNDSMELCVRLPSVEQQAASGAFGKCVLDPSLSQLQTFESVVKPNCFGNVLILAHNTSSQPVHIPDGKRMGRFQFIHDPNELQDEINALNSRPPTSEEMESDESQSPEEGVHALWHDPLEDTNDTKTEDPTDPSVIKRKEQEAEDRLKKVNKQQCQKIIEEFQLKDSHVLKSDFKLMKATILLLIEYDDIIGRGDRMGRTTLVTHDVDTGDTPPIRTKQRPINPSQEADLKKRIDQWLKLGIIKEGSSEWRFQLVAAAKKGTTDLRWCANFAPLNSHTRKDAYPMPDLSDNLARLARSKIFSALDCSGAFLNVPLTPRAQERCSFGCHLGSFIFQYMPFGLCNAPATFQRLMNKVFSPLKSSEALVYLDDALAHSSDPWDHFRIVKKIFERYRYAGLTIQPRKTFLFRDEVDYLGHRVSAKGLSTQPSYIEVVKNWPVPKTAKEIQIFLGKTGYYRRFVQNYSEVSGPLSEYIKEGNAKGSLTAPLQLDSEAIKCFEELKSRLCSAPILAFPDFNSEEPFILDTDFSGKSIGAVLSQKQDGKEHVIAYGAKKLLPRECSYSSNKGELLAAVYFVEKFKYFLSHRKFILRTDHQALKWLASMKTPAGMFSRWKEHLASYDFEVKFRKGTQHSNADSLSRTEHASELSEAELKDMSLHSISVVPPKEDRIDAKRFAEEQQKDSELVTVMKFVKSGEKPSKETVRMMSLSQRMYMQKFELLKLSAKGLLFMHDEKKKKARPCVPESLQDYVIKSLHQIGHPGIGHTYLKVHERFYFPDMMKMVELHVKTCEPCQKKVGAPGLQKHTHHPVAVGAPGQKWSIDIVGPFEEDEDGYKYILSAKDSFTRMFEAVPLKNMTAVTVAKALENMIFARYGFPEEIHSDNAKNLSGDVVNEVCRILNVRKVTGPVYSPKSNPVERSHRDLGNHLRAMMEMTGQTWTECLPATLLAMRTSKCESTSFSPFFLTYLRECKLPIDVMTEEEPYRKMGAIQYANEAYQRMKSAFRIAADHQKATLIKTRQSYNQQHDPEDFETGRLVWLYTPRTELGKSKKLHSRWSGPWRIQNVLSDVLRRIETHGDWNDRTLNVVVTLDRLKPYHAPTSASTLIRTRTDLTAEEINVPEDYSDTGELMPGQLESPELSRQDRQFSDEATEFYHSLYHSGGDLTKSLDQTDIGDEVTIGDTPEDSQNVVGEELQGTSEVTKPPIIAPSPTRTQIGTSSPLPPESWEPSEPPRKTRRPAQTSTPTNVPTYQDAIDIPKAEQVRRYLERERNKSSRVSFHPKATIKEVPVVRRSKRLAALKKFKEKVMM